MQNKWKTFLAIMVVVALMIPAQAFSARYEELTVTKLKVEDIEKLNSAGLTITNPTITGLISGDEWYVDSGVSTSGAGTGWDNAVATVDEAINLASANNGDVIHVAAGHAESFTAANGFDADIAGITIIGYGAGTDMPEFTFADTDADIALGAANVTLYNLRFLAGISAVVRGISVEAAADDCAIIACEFPEPTTSTFEFVRAILLATGADRLKVEGCTYYNADAVGTTNFIDIDTGIVNGIQIIDNYIYGEFAEGAIHTDKACLEMLIKDNTIVNMTTGQHGIEIAANATGLMIGNLVSTDAIGTSYDVGHLNEHDNYWDDYGTYDTMAVPWTTNETGVNRWGATELAQIEGEATDALEADSVDKLVAADDRTASLTYPDSVANESIMAFVMSKSASPVKTSYNNTTDSLEAIGDLVTLTAQEAEVEDALQAQNLDHVAGVDTTVAADADLTTYTADGSLLSHVMTAGADTSDYQASTDSLEAISVALAAGTGATAALDADYLDHLMNTDGATSVFPEQAAEDSTICKILADDDPAICATYNNATDSLEALGTKTTDTDYWQERTVSVSADEVTADLFDVAGGPILIKSITGIVDVLIGANATTCKLIIDRDDLTADTEFTTAVSIETDVAGTVYIFTSANAAVLTPLTPGAVGSSNLMSPWFCPEGMVEQTMSANPGGAEGDHITWYLTYVPLKAGVTVTAQ